MISGDMDCLVCDVEEMFLHACAVLAYEQDGTWMFIDIDGPGVGWVCEKVFSKGLLVRAGVRSNALGVQGVLRTHIRVEERSGNLGDAVLMLVVLAAGSVLKSPLWVTPCSLFSIGVFASVVQGLKGRRVREAKSAFRSVGMVNGVRAGLLVRGGWSGV